MLSTYQHEACTFGDRNYRLEYGAERHPLALALPEFLLKGGVNNG